jgi:Flp pilus assembly pilin Flp
MPNVITATSRAWRALKGRRGQSLAEYALVLSFFSLLSVVLLQIFTTQLRGLFTAILVALQYAWHAL